MKIVRLYLILIGTIGFAMFILEEAFQMMTFSTWPNNTTRHYAELLDTVHHMERTNAILRQVNSTIGWTNPLAYIAYREFTTAADRYIQSQKVNILANAPNIFDNETLTIRVSPDAYSIEKDGMYAHIGGIRVRLLHAPKKKAFYLRLHISGDQITTKGQFP